MVNYRRLYNLCSMLKAIGFHTTIETFELTAEKEIILFMRVSDIETISITHSDEQVAVNAVADRLEYLYRELNDWTHRSMHSKQ